MLYIILGIIALLLVHAWLMSTKPHKINWATSHVVITGGSSGIGLCAALMAVKRGAHVTILARNMDKLKAALKTLESARVNGDQKILALSTDVSDIEAVKKTIDDAVARNNGKMDLLIACAGETRPERFDEVDPKYFKRLMEINYLGVVYSILAVLPYMKSQKRGRVVVVGSLLSITGFPGYSPYTPTKYALKGLLDGLDIEYRPFNIYFQLAIPADVDTPMYVEENRVKPEETKMLSDPPTSPESVATSIMNAVDNYKYMISTGLQGMLLSLTVGGMSPGSFVEIVLQICFGGVLRAATVVFLKYYYYVVAKVRRKEKAL